MCQGVTSLDISNGNARLLLQASERIKLTNFFMDRYGKFEMQLIWKQKFIDLRVELEKIEGD